MRPIARPAALAAALTAAMLLLAPVAGASVVGASVVGASATRAAAADPEQVDLRVEWPSAPVKGKRAVVRVTRSGTGPATLALVSIRPRADQVVAERRITGRRATFRLRLAHNRTQLQIWAESAGTASESRIARSPLPRARRGARRFGQGPLRVHRAGQGLAIRFHGRRGQVVGYGLPGESCDAVELRGGGRVITPWTTLNTRPGRGQVWRLPGNGRFTLRTRACWDATPPSRLQLVHYRIRRLPPYGRPTALRVSARRVDVRRVDPTADRLLVRADREDGTPWSVLDAAGAPVADTSPLHLSAPTAPAFLVARRTDTVRVSTPLAVDVVADGLPVGSVDPIPGRERALRFTATAGATVTAVTPDPVRDVTLLGPDGAVIDPDPGSATWTTRVAGVHSLMVTPADPSTTNLRAGVGSTG